MNNEPMQLGLFDDMRLAPMKALASTNPALYFFMKHWRGILIGVLLLIISAMTIGAWKYHGHVNQKFAKLEAENKEYKNQADNLQKNIGKIQDDIEIANRQRQEFDAAIAALRTDADALRRKINGIGAKIPPGTTPESAQTTINELKTDIKNRWESIGKQEVTK